MNGYGSHTYSLLNATHERSGSKFHFKTMQGIACLTDREAATIVGVDRESHQRDLFDAIAGGDCPKWRLCVQIMPEQDAEQTPYHPFDLTKVWPHQEYPRIEVGIMELNRNPENDFAEVEQAAFEPSNIVPGISFSPDKMLQFRIFAYADAHRYRLGSTNYAGLPVNRPHATDAHTYHRDGVMRFDGNGGGAVNDEPNSFGGPVEDPQYLEPPLPIDGEALRDDHRAGNDDYAQPGNLFRLLPAAEQRRLFGNLAASMQGVPRVIIDRPLEHFRKADPAYAEGVAKALSLSRGNGHKAHAAD